MSAIERVAVESAKASRTGSKAGVGARAARKAKGSYRKLMGHKSASVKVSETPGMREGSRRVKVIETGSHNRFTDPRIVETHHNLEPGRKARSYDFKMQDKHLNNTGWNTIGISTGVGLTGVGIGASAASDSRTHKKEMQRLRKSATSAFGVDHGVISKKHERKKAAGLAAGSAGMGLAAPIAAVAPAMNMDIADQDSPGEARKWLREATAKHGKLKHVYGPRTEGQTEVANEIRNLKNAKAANRVVHGGLATGGALALGSIAAGAGAVHQYKNRSRR